MNNKNLFKYLFSSLIIGSGFVNFSSAGRIANDISSWFNGLRSNFLSFISPITSFFSSVSSGIVKIVSFIGDLFEFIGYGITVGLRYMWSLFDHLFSLSFWYDGFQVLQQLSVFLGIDTVYIAIMVFISVLLILFSFLTRLVFGKLNFLNKDKG